MQKELTNGPLLDESGNLLEAGFAFDLIKDYDRKKIKAHWSRIKEWDYYYVGNASYGVALTVADNSYMSLVGISILDFKSKSQITKTAIKPFTKGKVQLPSTSKKGDIHYDGKSFTMNFTHEGNKRHLVCSMAKFKGYETFRCDIYLEETTNDSMVIATPFNKAKHFYYNQKINCLKASGYAKVGLTQYDFNLDSYGVLDWGRGVWTYKNTWYWASMSGEYNSHRIGFNLGYGFGNTSAASENMLFYDDKAYKLEDVKFDIPIGKNGKDDFLSPWRFRNKDNSISLNFVPILNRHDHSNILLISSNQNQTFGLFSGKFVAEGKEITFENVLGFAEKVINRW